MSSFVRKDGYNLLRSRKQWRKDLIVLSLNAEFSILFLTKKEFHDRVRNSVTDSKIQLSLKLDNWTIVELVNDAPTAADTAEVAFDICSQDALTNLNTIRWRHCPRLPPLSFFSGVSALDFSSSPVFIDLTGLPQSVKYINLSRCLDVSSDVSPLAKCNTVILRGCKPLTKLGKLKEVRLLDLSCNGWLNDEGIIGLGQQKELNLSFCPGLKNVVHLSKVEKLDLNYCLQIPREQIKLLESGNFVSAAL